MSPDRKPFQVRCTISNGDWVDATSCNVGQRFSAANLIVSEHKFIKKTLRTRLLWYTYLDYQCRNWLKSICRALIYKSNREGRGFHSLCPVLRCYTIATVQVILA